MSSPEAIDSAAAEPAAALEQQFALGQLLVCMRKPSPLGCGGPMALLGYARGGLVARRKWISESDGKVHLTPAPFIPEAFAAPTVFDRGYAHSNVHRITLMGVACVFALFQRVLAIGLVAYPFVHRGRCR